MKLSSKKTGFSIVEALVAASIALTLVASLVAANNIYLNITFAGVKKVKAILLAEEGVEAVKLLRDNGWDDNFDAVPIGSDQYIYFSTTTNFWATTTANIYVDGIFERKFVLGNVYRDGNNDVAASGSLDPDGRLLTVTVSWQNKGATSTKSISTYLFNFLDD